MFTLAVAIVLSASLLVQWTALRVGVTNPGIQSQADTCIPQLQAANAAFKAAAAVDVSQGVDPNKHSLLLTETNVANTLRCQQAMVQVVGVPPAAAADGLRAAGVDGDPVVDNAQQSAGGNQPTNCAFTTAFPDGVIGLPYGGVNFRANNPFGGSAAASVSTTNPAGFCGNLDRRDYGWSGKCLVNADDTRSLTGQATITLGISAPFFLPATDPVTGGCPTGTRRGVIDPDGTFHERSDGNQCVLTPTEAVNGNCAASGAVPDYYKGVIKLDPTVGYCLLSCSASASFNWTAPKVGCPAGGFTATPNAVDKANPKSVGLTAVVSHAKTVTIDNGIGDVGPLDPSKAAQTIGPLTVKALPDPPGVTYTLVATGAGGDTCTMQAPLTVTDSTPATVTLTSPAADAVILDSGVTVSGVITPVPDPAHRMAQILVNGAFLSSATIDGSGNFSGRTALMNTIQSSDITLFGPAAVSVTSCGPRGADIGAVANPANGSKNLIRVVVPLANGSVSASVTVEHAVSLNAFRVSWGGDAACVGAPQNDPPCCAPYLFAGLAVPVGTVRCGFGGPAHCSGVATITVDTSVGSKSATESWTANINSCN